jgi:hypothetical protein
LQFLVHAGQGGHAFLAYDANFNPITSLVSDIPKEAFARMPQWSRVTSQLTWYAHANLNLTYRAGAYVLDQDTRVDGITLSAGAVVKKVDGGDVDPFVLQQQYRAHLRYDPALGKFYLYPLLNIDPGPGQPGWELVFRLSDGEAQSVFVQKIPGYVAHRPDESRVDNIRCLAIDEGLLFIKI